MSAGLRHRGPDGDGLWADETAGVALGHRRLAIVDLTEEGRQPMVSSCGRFVLCYNGELYNTDELRSRLLQQGEVFRGRSDTEVLLSAVARWGLEATLGQIVGIFAFAVWDRQSRSLSVVRDHLGVKPLFWSLAGDTFLFASELKSIAAVPGFDREIDPQAVGTFLQHNYIRAPLTIYRQARSLEPGHVLTLAQDGKITTRTYWSLRQVVSREAAARRRPVDAAEATQRIEAQIAESVRSQLVSDVPIGAFLSGGIDSSTVVALMQKAASAPVRSFSIGFEVGELDEAPAARAVAAHIGTDHVEYYATERDALQLVPDLPGIYDQPLADPSAIPTYLLCRLARQQVTVALSGDGGDELFYGYSRYAQAERVHKALRRAPHWALRLADSMWEPIAGRRLRESGFEAGGRINRAGWHASRLLHYASADVSDAYLHFITHRFDYAGSQGGFHGDFSRWEESKGTTSDFREQMMLHDATTYLPDCVLAKVDRASMASSLEVRVPLLDHRLVELAWSLPHDVKSRDGVGKWCLRNILYKHVPRELVDRPKAGFGAPVGGWLRGPLRDWAGDLLSPSAIARFGVIEPVAAGALWQAHSDRTVDAGNRLWGLVTLQAWLQEAAGTIGAQSEPLDPLTMELAGTVG